MQSKQQTHSEEERGGKETRRGLRCEWAETEKDFFFLTKNKVILQAITNEQLSHLVTEETLLTGPDIQTKSRLSAEWTCLSNTQRITVNLEISREGDPSDAVLGPGKAQVHADTLRPYGFIGHSLPRENWTPSVLASPELGYCLPYTYTFVKAVWRQALFNVCWSVKMASKGK